MSKDPAGTRDRQISFLQSEIDGLKNKCSNLLEEAKERRAENLRDKRYSEDMRQLAQDNEVKYITARDTRLEAINAADYYRRIFAGCVIIISVFIIVTAFLAKRISSQQKQIEQLEFHVTQK